MKFYMNLHASVLTLALSQVGRVQSDGAGAGPSIATRGEARCLVPQEIRSAGEEKVEPGSDSSELYFQGAPGHSG